jgi:predicted hydrocarbon binding protein/KaiC/GvpD/RAD55 family RecA-like ATPase
MSLAKIREPPDRALILLAGPPGAGKSTFCHQVVLNSVAADRPILFVTTERSVPDVVNLLTEKGLGAPAAGALGFADAFAETVGLAPRERPDTVGANYEDLNSMSMAIAKLKEEIARRDILLAFDSLTSPYLFNEKEVFRFIRLCLVRFAAGGNSVVALMDEGCGRSEDLVAMMSIADGVTKTETEEDTQFLNGVKHPEVRPTRIEVPIEPEEIDLKAVEMSFAQMDSVLGRQFMQSVSGKDEAALRRGAGDFVNLFWPSLAHWSGMLWDPKRFPAMIYELNKQDGVRANEFMRLFGPWQMRLLFKLGGLLAALGVFPKSLSEVKDTEKMWRWMQDSTQNERSAVVEYLDEVSNTDEHYFRVYENADCWGFGNIGTAMASHLPDEMAGLFKAAGEERRDWNAVETKCIGLGDPYCEFRFVPGEIEELRGSLEKDSSVIERIHERLMNRFMGFLLHGKPLVERPRLGSHMHLHPVIHAFGFPNVAGERYRMALRMGGARSGKEVGERLVEAGLSEDEAVRRVLRFLEHCKVGKVNMDETIRIRENCEPLEAMMLSMTKRQEPSCFFTTGFLNGLFSAVRNQHVKETKCIAMGDPYCEWEII